MATLHKDTQLITTQSVISGLPGCDGVEMIGRSTTGWTLSNFTAQDKTVSATESTAANIAASLATLVDELIRKGVINKVQ